MRPARRAGRRTNVALLVLLVVAAGSGVAGYLVGAPAASRVVAVVHGASGLGILLLAPWKSLVVRRAWRRSRPTGAAAALTVSVAMCIVAGAVAVGWGWAATRGFALQVHVGAALLAAVLVVAHVARHRQGVRRVDLSRRVVLQSLGLGAGSVAAYAASGLAFSALALPGARSRETGSTPVGSADPAAMPVTQWFLDGVPAIDPAAWRLRVSWPGASRAWSLAELVTLPLDEVRAVLDCTGGWYAEQVWAGVRLDELLPAAALGRSILVTSATGYSRRFARTDAGGLWLATGVGGLALSAGHGAPARLVVPGRRGYWWVKWAVSIEVDEAPSWWQPPLPL